MRWIRLRPLLFVALLLLPWRAWAGDAENFQPCVKSNDCKSLRCSGNVCKPSMQWNGQGVLGSKCESDGNCKSRACVGQRCVAPKPAPTRAPSSRATPSDAAPRFVPEPDELPAVELDSCSKPLVDDLFQDDPEHAVEICRMYDAETIARARTLSDARYGVGFTDTCRAIVGHGDAAIACGRKAFDALPPDDRDVPFKIPVSCLRKQTPEESSRCTKDLLSTVGKALRPQKRDADAAYACATYDTRTLETAKKVVAAGYAGDFLHICRAVDGRSSEELACARKEYAAFNGNSRSESIFIMPEECESRAPRK